MNNKFLFGAALAATVLTSCSQDSVLDAPAVNGDAIRFAVTNGATTRAAQSYCNTNLPGTINVFASEEDATDLYINGDVASRSGNSSNYTTSPEKYWPQSGKLDFYAWVNGNDANSTNSAVLADYAPATDAAHQLDVLYAVAPGATRAEGQVKLNFRHALSQIVFSARNESTKGLGVTIKGVKIGHINSKGTYTLDLTTSTKDNYVNHDENLNTTDNRQGLGRWDLDENADLAVYETTVEDGTVKTTDTPLTWAKHEGGVDGSFILLPQTQTAWTLNGTSSDDDIDGAYFVLDLVYTQNGNTVFEGDAYVPVDVEWNQGYRYKYTFIFSDDNGGGYIPGDTPTPVLGGIKYIVTCDDFVPADNEDVNVEGNGTTPSEAYTYSLQFQGYDAITEESTEASTTFTGTVPALPQGVEVPAGKVFVGWACGNEFIAKDADSYSVILTSDAVSKIFTPVYYNHFSLKFGDNAELTADSAEDSYTFAGVNPTAPTVAADKEFLGWSKQLDVTTPDVGYEANNAPYSVTVNDATTEYYPVIVDKMVTYTITLLYGKDNEKVKTVTSTSVKVGEDAKFTVPAIEDDTYEVNDGNVVLQYRLKGFAATSGLTDPDDATYRLTKEYSTDKSITLYPVYSLEGESSGTGGDNGIS